MKPDFKDKDIGSTRKISRREALLLMGSAAGFMVAGFVPPPGREAQLPEQPYLPGIQPIIDGSSNQYERNLSRMIDASRMFLGDTAESSGLVSKLSIVSPDNFFTAASDNRRDYFVSFTDRGTHDLSLEQRVYIEDGDNRFRQILKLGFDQNGQVRNAAETRRLAREEQEELYEIVTGSRRFRAESFLLRGSVRRIATIEGVKYAVTVIAAIDRSGNAAFGLDTKVTDVPFKLS